MANQQSFKVAELTKETKLPYFSTLILKKKYQFWLTSDGVKQMKKVFKKHMVPKVSAIIGLCSLLFFALYPRDAYAMHIMEGMLPPKWCIFWFAVSAPFFIYGLHRLKVIVTSTTQNAKVMLALCGAFVFVLSSLKLRHHAIVLYECVKTRSICRWLAIAD